MSVSWKKIESDNDIDKILNKYCTNSYRKGWIELGEEKLCVPESYVKIIDEVENFEVKDSDVFVAGHPKAGLTWMQEMVWMIINNLDFERAKEQLYVRVPFLEFEGIFDNYDYNTFKNADHSHVYKSIEACKNYPHSPRLMKTHLPYSALPKQIREGTTKPKIIYILRNPKDTCISYYHHYCLLEGYKGNLDDFCKLFLAGRILFSPFWTHIMSYWEHKHDPNILFVKYEDMKKDLASCIIQVANFLGCKLTNEQIKLLENHLNFENMSRNESVNKEEFFVVARKLTNMEGKFMRSGIIGSYKAEFNQNLIDTFDKWTEEHTKGTSFCES